MTFAELKTLLFARGNFGMKLGLERMQAALELLGNPHRAAPALHIAGSNGKGSTCAFAEAALRAAGLKTGLYTSPHLMHLCERIRVDGAPISEESAAALLEEILARVPWALAGGPAGAQDGDGLTFFELVTLMGFLAFARAGVEVMVIEVGLGGRLDATNVVLPLACAIAPLALEHTQYLGDTIEAIAGEKAGIIKPGVPVASAGQALPAARVLAEAAARNGSLLWRPGRDYRFESRDRLPFCYRSCGTPNIGTPQNMRGMPTIAPWTVRLEPPASDPAPPLRDPRSGLALRGSHQRQNAALACALLELAAARGLRVAPVHLEQGLSLARWPGRLQAVGASPLVLLDGAHNPHGAGALARALPAQLSAPPQLLFGALEGKELAGILRPLLPLVAGVHLCAPATPRALSPEVLRALVSSLAPALPCATYRSTSEALEGARSAATPSGAVLACGSLYLVGELLALLEQRPIEAMPSERLRPASLFAR